MAQIYSPPEELQAPELNIKLSWEESDQQAQEWLEQLRQFCKDNGAGKYAGKIVRDQVADGYAKYMVFSLRPLILIHIPLGDAWHSQWSHRWTASDVREMADREEAMVSMFS